MVTTTVNKQVYLTRLKTYETWPNPQISPKRLCKAGFYYIQTADIVRCAFCNVEGYNWERNDDPLEDHRRWKPDCPFITHRWYSLPVTDDNCEDTVSEKGLGNLSLEETCLPNGSVCEKDIVKSALKDDNDDDYKIHEIEKKTPAKESNNIRSKLTETDNDKMQNFIVKKSEPPLFPEYVLVAARLRSFISKWPIPIQQPPEQLSEAGFFYEGTKDRVLCFQCGGGLEDWDVADNVWEQHAKWYPSCEFMLHKRGPNDIDCSLKQHSLRKLSPEISASVVEERFSSTRLPCENDQMLCKICFTNEMNMVLLPCRHVVACVDCSLTLDKCAVCQQEIEGSVKIFIS